MAIFIPERFTTMIPDFIWIPLMFTGGFFELSTRVRGMLSCSRTREAQGQKKKTRAITGARYVPHY
jgi:hypothetical protein